MAWTKFPVDDSSEINTYEFLNELMYAMYERDAFNKRARGSNYGPDSNGEKFTNVSSSWYGHGQLREAQEGINNFITYFVDPDKEATFPSDPKNNYLTTKRLSDYDDYYKTIDDWVYTLSKFYNKLNGSSGFTRKYEDSDGNIVTDYGYIQGGDIIGKHIFDEIYDALNLLHTVCRGANYSRMNTYINYKGDASPDWAISDAISDDDNDYDHWWYSQGRDCSLSGAQTEAEDNFSLGGKRGYPNEERSMQGAGSDYDCDDDTFYSTSLYAWDTIIDYYAALGADYTVNDELPDSFDCDVYILPDKFKSGGYNPDDYLAEFDDNGRGMNQWEWNHILSVTDVPNVEKGTDNKAHYRKKISTASIPPFSTTTPKKYEYPEWCMRGWEIAKYKKDLNHDDDDNESFDGPNQIMIIRPKFIRMK